MTPDDRPAVTRGRHGRYSAPGTAPGTLGLSADAPPPEIDVIGYGPTEINRGTVASVEELDPWLQRFPVVWVDVDGHGTGEFLETLGKRFGLHPLALEDVVNIGQRAKVESYDDHLFLIARQPIEGGRDTEQIAFFLGDRMVISLQEKPGDCFEGVRERLRRGNTRIRQGGPDYLLYALLDAIVDSYFPVMEDLSGRLEVLEEQVLGEGGQDAVPEIYRVRRTLLSLRKAVAPHREAVNTLIRDESPLVSEQTTLFLRDVHDHALRIVDLLESLRELSGDVLSTHMTVVSNRMNEVMKVLTIIATIFIPLSFIAGLYGMNFDTSSPWNMPELGLRFGYPMALGLMALIGLGFVWWIRRKGWFD